MSTEIENRAKKLEYFYQQKIKPAIDYKSKGLDNDEKKAIFSVGVSLIVEFLHILNEPLNKENIKKYFKKLDENTFNNICKELNI